MNIISTEFFDRSGVVFTGNTPPTLAQVRDRVDREWTGTKRRDHLSALSSLARVKTIDLQNIPATVGAVRKLLASHNALELGLSEPRWRNIRSAVAAAVRAFGFKPKTAIKQMAINAEWSDLLARIKIKHHRHGLTRFARFCSALSSCP